MGGMFGGSSRASNDAVVQQQEQAAADARQKETERQARIDAGLLRIKQAVHGAPIMGTRQVQKTREVAAPASGTATSGPGGHYEDRNSMDNTYQAWVPDAPSTQATAAPTTETYTDTENYDTGQTTGGIDDAYYNKYKQGVIDYYMPQVTDQFTDANKELIYRLARASQTKSSAATTELAKLNKQKLLNEGQVYTKADTAAADLRNRVSSEEAKAQSQLYATENPDVAANQAIEAVRNIGLEKPNYSPLGQVFSLGTIGGANALAGYQNQTLSNKYSDPTSGSRSRVTYVG